MKKFLLALLIGAIVANICLPVMGFILRLGTEAGVFSLNEVELATGAKMFSYGLGAFIFFGIVRGNAKKVGTSGVGEEPSSPPKDSD